MSLRKEIIRIMAEAERRMDSGELPFVLAPGPTGIFERFPLEKERMEEYGLVQGQHINTIIRDTILEDTQRKIRAIQEEGMKKVAEFLEKIVDMEDENDVFLDDKFDFRDMMKDEDGNEPTKH